MEVSSVQMLAPQPVVELVDFAMVTGQMGMSASTDGWDTFTLTWGPVWGIDADGNPYYDAGGVPSSDIAYLWVDDLGVVTLSKITGITNG